MTELTLLYFPFAGRAGAIRDAFRIGKIPFEDKHVGRDDFRRMKTEGELPYGSLPALDIGGDKPHRIAQSNAILRYAGRLSGLYPSDPLEALRVDELLDFAEDMNHALAPSMREQDMDKKLAMRKVLTDETIPMWVRCIESRLDANDDPLHLVGKALSIADLKLLHGFDSLVSGVLDGVPKTVLDGYAKLGAWRTAVQAERDARLAPGA
jgi:glutathione S-transferase